MSVTKFALTGLLATILALMPSFAFASGGDGEILNLTTTTYGIIALILFTIAYTLVIGEEFLHLRKSKPVIVAAGIIWALVGFAYASHGDQETASIAFRHNLLEFGELMLFLLAAMTYINTLEERNMFAALRS